MSKYTPGKWSEDGINLLLRYGRKNSGGWDYVDDGKNMPDESDALLASKSPEMYEMLKRLEWSFSVDVPIPGPMRAYACVCPECYQSMQAGHLPDCPLGKLLKELESVEGNVSDKSEVSK